MMKKKKMQKEMKTENTKNNMTQQHVYSAKRHKVLKIRYLDDEEFVEIASTKTRKVLKIRYFDDEKFEEPTKTRKVFKIRYFDDKTHKNRIIPQYQQI